MRHVALKVPLGFLAIRRRRQGDYAANARVEPLGDPLDDAALAGRVPPFKQHHQLVARVLNPVLKLHEFRLQPEQMPEIVSAEDVAFAAPRALDIRNDLFQPFVVELELQLLIKAVGQLRLNPLLLFLVRQPVRHLQNLAFSFSHSGT